MNQTITRPLFLIGYMGSGKTTLGRAIAKATGREFFDLDFYISQRFRMSVTDLFATRGEEGFRIAEASMLREAGEFCNAVIACGGGTPCFHGNMDYMLSRGPVVWLQASPERLAERLAKGQARRPLLAGLSPAELPEFIRQGLLKRMDHYSRASHTFESSQLEDRRQIASAVKQFLDAGII